MGDLFGGGGGSTTSTTQVNVPPPTAAELQLQEINVQTAQALFDQLGVSLNLQNNVLLPLFAEQAGVVIERGAGPAVHEILPGIPAILGNNPQTLASVNKVTADTIAEIARVGPARQSTLRGELAILEQQQAIFAAPPTGAGAQGVTGFSLTPEAQNRLDLSQQVQTAGLEAQLASTESAQALAETLIAETPEFSLEDALAFIDTAAQSAIASGENEILKFQDLALENLRDVFAPARGLRPSDSPIREFAGGRVLEESTRQQGQLVRDVTTTSEQLKVNAQQFQATLEQAAFVNRTNLLGTLGNFGLGFPSAPSSGQQLAPIGAFGAGLATSAIPGAGLQASLAQQRLGAAGSTTTGTTSGGGNVAGGLAGLAIGLGSLGFNPFGAAGIAGAAGGSAGLSALGPFSGFSGGGFIL